MDDINTSLQPNNIPQLPILSKKKSLSKVGWSLAILLLITQIGGMIIGALSSMLNPELLSNVWFLWLASQAPNYLIALPIILLFLKPVPALWPEKIQKPTLKEMSKYLAMSYAIMYLFNILSLIINFGIGLIKGGPVQNPLQFTLSDPLASLVCVVIIAPIMEEFVYRKVILSRLLPYGEAFAAITSGLLFALMHGNLSQFFYAFALGTFWAYLTIRTGSILYTIFLHVAANFIGTIVMPYLINFGTFGAILSLVLILVLLVGGLFLLIKDRHKFHTFPSPDGSSVKQSLKIFVLTPGFIVYLLLSLILIVLMAIV